MLFALCCVRVEMTSLYPSVDVPNSIQWWCMYRLSYSSCRSRMHARCFRCELVLYFVLSRNEPWGHRDSGVPPRCDNRCAYISYHLLQHCSLFLICGISYNLCDTKLPCVDVIGCNCQKLSFVASFTTLACFGLSTKLAFATFG